MSPSAGEGRSPEGPAASALVDDGRSVPDRGGHAQREQEWGRRFGALTLAWLAFETVSGLSIYLLPFSVPNQWQVVLAHRGGPRVSAFPSSIYQWQHLVAYWPRPRTPIK